MGSPWYKIMLGMSYYIHAGGLGALKALPGSVSKRVTPVAAIVLSSSDHRELDDGSRPDLPAAIVKGSAACGHHSAID